MMKLAANLSWMYRSLAWSDRFAAAARDGFEAVEILLPYDEPPQWYASRMKSAGLELALINTPVEPGRGCFGWAAIAGAEAAFRSAFDRARAVAQATGCRSIHVMAGQVAGLDAAACRAALLRNLEAALQLAEQEDLVLMLEPLNRVDAPGYGYHLPAQVIGVLEQFGSPRLRLQFDFYHCVMENLSLDSTLEAAAPWIGHVQIAGAPERHEPELSRDGLQEAVASLPGRGYDGWLGCEYAPRGEAAEGLQWCAPLRRCGALA